MEPEELLKMKLHDSLDLNDRLSVLRVIGGWIYRFTDGAVFVPEVLNVECKRLDK